MAIAAEELQEFKAMVRVDPEEALIALGDINIPELVDTAMWAAVLAKKQRVLTVRPRTSYTLRRG